MWVISGYNFVYYISNLCVFSRSRFPALEETLSPALPLPLLLEQCLVVTTRDMEEVDVCRLF